MIKRCHIDHQHSWQDCNYWSLSENVICDIVHLFRSTKGDFFGFYIGFQKIYLQTFGGKFIYCQFDSMEEVICQVCFNNPTIPPLNNPLLKCSKCHLTAHKYCYAPDSTTDHFLCDLCREEAHVVCNWCQNPGLLKRAGKHYGHPICLFFNASVMVNRFSSLSFIEVETNSRFPKLKCSYCKKTTSSVLRCCLQCKQQTHIYCALKHSNTEEGKGWKLTLQPLNNFKSYLEPYKNLVLRALRTHSPFLASQLGIKKATKTIEVGVNLYCQEHAVTFVQCVCRQFNEEKLKWVYCEGCCRWQHQECLIGDPALTEILKEETKEPYLCIECREWRKWQAHPYDKLPEKLPKMHIYDYIALHCLLEQYQEQTPQNLVQFLITVPLLPGMMYAELFFRKELVKKLKHKIDFPPLKAKVEQLQENKQMEGLFHFLDQNKDRVELIWFLTEGSLFGEQTRPFSHHLDRIDPEFVNEIMEAFVHFEQMYGSKRNHACLNGPTTRNSFKVKEEQVSEGQTYQKDEGDINGSIFSKSSKKKSEKDQKNHQQRQKMTVLLSDALEKIIIKFSESNFLDFQSLFTELHQITSHPCLRSLLQELPKNIFTNSILQFETVQESLTFMQYMAHINYIQNEWEKLKAQEGGMLTARQYQQVQQLNLMVSCLNQQIYQLNHPQMKQILKTEIFQRQSQDKLSCWAYQNPSNYRPQTWTVIPDDMLNLKDIKALIKVKKLNQQNSPRLNLGCDILQQLSTIQFKKQFYLNSKGIVVQLMELYPQLSNLLNEYIFLYEKTSLLLNELGVKYHDDECLFKVLDSVKIKQLKKEKKSCIVNFLSEIDKLRLRNYSLTVQQTIKDFVISFFTCYFQQKEAIQTQSQLQLIKNWLWRLNVSLPFLEKLIKNDKDLCNRFVFVEPRFELPQVIDRIEIELNKALEEVGADSLQFRVKKMRLILQWIKTYKLILRYLPLQYILSQDQWSQLNHKYKPQLQSMIQFLNIMDKMCFPNGQFKEKLEGIIGRGKKLKTVYEQIMAGCQWNFQFGKHQTQWDKKIPLPELVKFVEEAQLVPLNLQVEILESQIVIQKFQEFENMSGLLLAQASQKTLKDNGFQRAQQILNHFGATPLKSHYTEKVIQLMDQLLGRSRMEVEIQQLFLKVQQRTPLPYKTITEALEWLQQEKVPQKLNVEILKESIVPINECMELYQSEIEQFCSQEPYFNQIQRDKVRQLSNKISKTSIFLQVLSEMAEELSEYENLMFSMKQIQHGRELNDMYIKRTLTRISVLHPCFQDKEIEALKIKLQQQMGKKGDNN